VRETKIPPESWVQKAKHFIESAQKELLLMPRVLAWLKVRGISEEAVHTSHLGWNGIDLNESGSAWGIDKDIWVPRGLVIPFCKDGLPIRIRLRRPDPGQGPRYVLLRASDTRPMTFKSETPAVVIVESELDAIMLWHQVKRLVTVVSLGNAQSRPDEATYRTLEDAKIILSALDSDEAGAKASWNGWMKSFGDKVKRWPVPLGKDPGEAYQLGVEPWKWVLAGLLQDKEVLERFVHVTELTSQVIVQVVEYIRAKK